MVYVVVVVVLWFVFGGGCFVIFMSQCLAPCLLHGKISIDVSDYFMDLTSTHFSKPKT